MDGLFNNIVEINVNLIVNRVLRVLRQINEGSTCADRARGPNGTVVPRLQLKVAEMGRSVEAELANHVEYRALRFLQANGRPFKETPRQ